MSVEGITGTSPLSTHFAKGLQKANGSYVDEGFDGPVSWSAWSYRDGQNQTWRGLFFALDLPEAEDGKSLHWMMRSEDFRQVPEGRQTSIVEIANPSSNVPIPLGAYISPACLRGLEFPGLL